MTITKLINELEKIKSKYGDTVTILIKGRQDVGGRDVAQVKAVDQFGDGSSVVVVIYQD